MNDPMLRRMIVHTVIMYVIKHVMADGQFITADSLKQEVVNLLHEWIHDTHFHEYVSLETRSQFTGDEPPGSS